MRILRNGFGTRYRAIVVGAGRDADAFVARARELGILDTAISFLGLLPHADALRTIAAADIGVIPHHSTELWNSTIPNKLFDYMAAGMPVVSSDTTPCARIIRETGCGEIFQSGDAQSMADAIVRACSADAATRMATAGRRAILERYNWEHETATLLDTIRNVTRRGT
jgi:glycosyltransferase involved in cell wall biosynthesis